MADNAAVSSGALADGTYAFDDIGGIKYPRGKIGLGADGSATDWIGGAGTVSNAVARVTVATDDALTVAAEAIQAAVEGTLTVGSHAVTNTGTFSVQAAQSGSWTVGLSAVDNAVLDSIVTALGGTLTVDGSGVTQPVSGTVTANLSAVDNAVLDSIVTALGGTLTVDGSGVTQPISGTVTANLGATDNAVLDVIASAVATDDDDFTQSATPGNPVMGVYETSPTSVTAGDLGMVGITATRALRTDADNGRANLIRVSPTISTGGYTADDCFGGIQTISNAARTSGGGGLLAGISMQAEDDGAADWAGGGVDVLIFDSNPGTGTYTDGTALNVADADVVKLVAIVTLHEKGDLGNTTILQNMDVRVAYECAGSANLYAVAVDRDGVTADATDGVQFTYHVFPD